MRSIKSVLAIAASTMLLFACGGGSSVSPSSTVTTTSGPPTVQLSEFRVDTAKTVAAGDVSFHITNKGAVQHELLVFTSSLAPSAYPVDSSGTINEDDPQVTKVSDGDNIDPGASQDRTITLAKGTYVFVCNLPGHFKAGMYTVVNVT